MYGDIELFAHEANAPVLGITGSNGKSTATLLAAHLFKEAGLEAETGGNLGTPALSLLREPAPDAYVLELSSFQLEATETLHCRAAGLLNLSPDHIDRHGSFEAYREIKHRLYRHAEVAVFNRDDSNTRPGITAGRAVSFGLDVPQHDGDFGLREHNGQNLAVPRLEPAAALWRVQLEGRHNWANALAALALAEAFGVRPEQAALDLCSFEGLPHRLQSVAEFNGVRWVNDSKATNLSAMQAALSAFTRPLRADCRRAGQTGGSQTRDYYAVATRTHLGAVRGIGPGHGTGLGRLRADRSGGRSRGGDATGIRTGRARRLRAAVPRVCELRPVLGV